MSAIRSEAGAAFRLTCKCGVEDISIAIPYPVELADIPEEVENLAEDRGWGSAGFCPACQAAMDKDVAECNAADAANITATTSGRGSRPRAKPSSIAIGVKITPTALFETTSVRVEASA